jgi:hypothetical protein
MRKRDFYHTGLDISRSELADLRRGNPSGAADYYMDLNVSATGDGSINYPFSTLAEAIAASNTSIGLRDNRWWARRNRIFCMGDEINEDITVLPEKCDIIGVGTDLAPYPRFMHSWAITTGVKGCRFINLGFMNDAADASVSLPAGSHGNEFWDCHFIRETGGTYGLTIVTSANIKIIGCEFLPDGAGGLYTTAAIRFLTGACYDFEIRDCYIEGAIGVTIDAANFGSRIVDSTIRSTGLVIVDTGLTTKLSNCRFITAAACGGAAGPTALTANPKYASGCWLATDDSNGPYPNLTAMA